MYIANADSGLKSQEGRMDMQHDAVFLHYQDERLLISSVTLCWCPFEEMLLRQFPVIATHVSHENV